MKASATLVMMTVLLFSLTSFGFTQRPANSYDEIDAIHDLILESNVKQLEQFLNNGGDVNAVDEIGNSALFFAAKIGDKKTVDLLLRHGAKVNATNESGATPLMIAAKYGNIYTTRVLLNHGADPEIQNMSGYTAYHFATAYERYELLDLLASN